MVHGTLYIISAPSGAGKSSLIQALLETKSDDNARLSVSHTTRQPRSGELHGKHYFFITVDEFKKLINEDAFIEHAEVFGNFYGTSYAAIEAMLAQDVDVFLDIDWQGAQQVRQKIPLARSIFILPPSKEELERRLRSRKQDSDDIIANRMKEAVSEISHYSEYDYLIINNCFDTALNEFQAIVLAERLKSDKQQQLYRELISKLLAD